MGDIVFRRPPSRGDAARPRSLWLQEAMSDDKVELPTLSGTEQADVCIVGGGFAGLWTALNLKTDNPSLDVVLLEADRCGTGPSGRNAGVAMSWWGKFSTLKKLCGAEEARRLADASVDAITAIGRFCEENGIDAHFHNHGFVWTATSPAQIGDWESAVSAAESIGARPFERLEDAEVARRAHSPSFLAGVFEEHCASLQPATLVRGLTRVASERGVRIFEHSPVARIALNGSPVVHAESGSVNASRVVVAVNAWAASTLREFSGSLVVVASDCIATSPIGDRLAEVGWDSGVTVVDSHRLLNYMRRTDEGRVVFGKAGGTLAYRGRVNAAFHGESPRATEVESHFRRLFPALADVPIEASWRGPIDYSIVGLPSVTYVAGRRDVIAVAGFSGNGVAPSRVTARIIASLLQERDDEWANAGLVGLPRGGLPPEPFRYAGGRIVRAAIARKERIEDTGKRPSPIIRAIAKLDPTSFADLGEKK